MVDMNLSQKINGIIIVTIALVFLVIGIFETTQTKRNLENELHEMLEDVSERLSKSLIEPLWSLDYNVIKDYISSEFNNKNVVAIVVYDSGTELSKNLLAAVKIRGINDTPPSALKTFLKANPALYSKQFYILKNNTINLGRVNVYLTDKYVKEQIKKDIFYFILQSTIILAVIVITLGIFLNISILKPVKNLTKVSQIIARGDLDQILDDTLRKDEIGILAKSFSNMRDAIREKIQDLNLEIQTRKKAENNLKKSEEKYRKLFRNIADPIFIFDYDTYAFLGCNQATIDKYGWSREELLLKTVFQLHSDSEIEKAKSNIQKRKNQIDFDKKDAFEYTHNKKDGSTIVVEVNSAIMEFEGKKAFLSIARDITERKRAEEELKKHRTRLEELVEEKAAELKTAQKELIEKAHRAGMAEMATNSLHNIGNILNSVNISNQILQETIYASSVNDLREANNLLSQNIDNLENFFLKNPKGNLLLEYYLEVGERLFQENETMKEHTDRLKNKIEAIMEVIVAQQSYAGAVGLTEKMDVVEIIESAIVMQRSVIEKHNITLIRDFQVTPKLKIQKAKLLHILINLIQNAKDAVIKSNKPERTIKISVEKNSSLKSAYLIKVCDNGIGIPDGNKTEIFTHGFTTKKNGHGFGLHSCANYMTEMGGAISVESNGKNQGTEFILKFEDQD